MDEGRWQLRYRGGDVGIGLLVRPNPAGHTLNVRGQARSLAGHTLSLAGYTLDSGLAEALPVAGHTLDSGVVEALPVATPRRLDVVTEPSARSELPTGEFALSNLERGRYDMLVRFGAREIELTDVAL